MASSESTVKDLQEIEDDQRERSTVDFPYFDLEAAMEIAKGVHQFGSTCSWDQLAAQLGSTAPKGGGFRMRVMTARTFGLVTYAQQSVTLTRLGMQICDEPQEKAARAEAFLAVELYNKIYDKYKGVALPPVDGLETEIVNFGVAPKQKAKARQTFQRSATQAGFFWSGANRLVKPSIKASATPAVTPEIEPETGPDKKKGKEKEADDSPQLHPLIKGLLEELPEPKTEWPLDDRRNWLEMVSSIFNVIYKASDDSRGSLRVVVEKNSAKQ